MRNEYRIEDDVVYIQLYRRKENIYVETMVDLDDLDKLLSLDVTWYPVWIEQRKTYLVKATQYLGSPEKKKPKYSTFTIHRFLTDAPQGTLVDHKNHNTLDNRQSENLRVVTPQQNSINRKGANFNSTTGVRNVTIDKSSNKFIVQLQVNGRNTQFGRFDTLEEAKERAESVRKRLYDEPLSKIHTNKRKKNYE